MRCTSAAMAADRTSLLLRWYERERRDLPWRRTRDPYAILVSEVMLQQTQVARVVPRYEAWLTRWPTVDALAAATLEAVLREWVGLGYNRRAMRLWEAARVVARDGWPERLQDLPGVGPYTAAAVGSFAFGRHEVALDTNARRLFARLGAALPPPPGRAADFNQATMELGATVCTARAPRCGACPLRAGCGGAPAPPARGRARGRVGGPQPRAPRRRGGAGARALRGLQPLGPRPRGGGAGGGGGRAARRRARPPPARAAGPLTRRPDQAGGGRLRARLSGPWPWIARRSCGTTSPATAGATTQPRSTPISTGSPTRSTICAAGPLRPRRCPPRPASRSRRSSRPPSAAPRRSARPRRPRHASTSRT